MKHLKYRNTRIVNELMNYCYKNGADKIRIEVNTQKEATEFFIKAFDVKLDNKSLALMKKLLNATRSHELEEHYWILAGDTDTHPELTLIGIMTDEVEIKYSDENILDIYLKRMN
ncbi:hypothetical protein KQI89_17180 [Clostridium sp. MSJ-4]|uniref:Uncharacterized protein n=1 Tax=Clostridium simiarum TaxID=2841506 RepID=A0ABS6F4N1_9CLOT|nr:hypothetical protein [Clostridium simiarum]MBU5593475.1 hypothetical protein [Clostridium simiarum]